MRFLGVIVAGAFVTPERSKDSTTSDSQCDPEVVERLEAHVAYLGREVALMREGLASVETVTLRHDAALAGLSRLGRSAHIDADGDLVLSGINLRLVGNEDPSESANGKGNLLLGHGTPTTHVEGSHNIVVGPGHTVTGHEGLILGSSHVTTGSHSVVLGGAGSEAGSNGVSLGSLYGGAIGQASIIIGGRDLWTFGARSILIGGEHQDAEEPAALYIGGAPYSTE